MVVERAAEQRSGKPRSGSRHRRPMDLQKLRLHDTAGGGAVQLDKGVNVAMQRLGSSCMPTRTYCKRGMVALLFSRDEIVV